MNNKNSNTTTRNICDSKNDNKAHHNILFILATMIMIVIIINESNLIRYYENDGCKIGNGECKMTCAGETYEHKMLKSSEFINCHEPLSQELIDERYRTPIKYIT